jgi:hypothetical protein
VLLHLRHHWCGLNRPRLSLCLELGQLCSAGMKIGLLCGKAFKFWYFESLNIPHLILSFRISSIKNMYWIFDFWARKHSSYWLYGQKHSKFMIFESQNIQFSITLVKNIRVFIFWGLKHSNFHPLDPKTFIFYVFCSKRFNS